MYPSTSFSEMAQRDLEEFEGDLKRYKAANRRSVWYGAGLSCLVLTILCLILKNYYLEVK